MENEQFKKENNQENKNLAIPFVLWTMGIAWFLWWGVAIANQFNYFTFGTPVMMVCWLIGGWSPAIVSIMLILKTKLISIKTLLKTIFDFKQPIYMYVIVIALAVLMYIIPLLMNRATIINPISTSIIMLPMNLIFGGGLEEIGWRFLFQPTLERKMSFTSASIITSTIWALWHLPLFYMDGTNQTNWSFLNFAILVFGIAFALAAIYRVTKSVFLCILFHGAWNSINESISMDMDIVSCTTIAIITIVISYILIKVIPKFSQEENSKVG